MEHRESGQCSILSPLSGPKSHCFCLQAKGTTRREEAPVLRVLRGPGVQWGPSLPAEAALEGLAFPRPGSGSSKEPDSSRLISL